MRVISGSLKGKKIIHLQSSNTRPLKDLVKESIFNIILHSNLFSISLKNSRVLDLYSGIGSFGIECISRGSMKVTFVEKDKNALNILNQNLKKMSIGDKAEVFPSEIKSFFDQLKTKNKFDIVFFDPPFTDNKYKEYLKLIKNLKILNKKNLIIIHREKKSVESFENILKVLFSKNYGRSKVIFGII
tara:strand:- start:37 stop:597 length:561 start_codon:yes stop_codon:yes gene_type:complete